jgi:hypothetical protein
VPQCVRSESGPACGRPVRKSQRERPVENLEGRWEHEVVTTGSSRRGRRTHCGGQGPPHSPPEHPIGLRIQLISLPAVRLISHALLLECDTPYSSFVFVHPQLHSLLAGWLAADDDDDSFYSNRRPLSIIPLVHCPKPALHHCLIAHERGSVYSRPLIRCPPETTNDPLVHGFESCPHAATLETSFPRDERVLRERAEDKPRLRPLLGRSYTTPCGLSNLGVKIGGGQTGVVVA